MQKGSSRSLAIFGATLFLCFAVASVVRADPPPAAEAAAKPAAPEPAKAPPAPQPQTISDPSIDIDDLKLLIEPMTKPELEIEANGWFSLLRAKVKEISDAELAVRRKNREIAALKEVKKAAVDVSKKIGSGSDEPMTDAGKEAATKLADANAKLSQVDASKSEEPKKDAPRTAAPKPAAAKGATPAPQLPSDKDVLKKAVENARKAAEKTGDQSVVDEKIAAAKKEADAASQSAAITTSSDAPASDAKQAESLAAKSEQAAAAKADVKVQLVDYSTKLAAERTGIIDRLKVVLICSAATRRRCGRTSPPSAASRLKSRITSPLSRV